MQIVHFNTKYGSYDEAVSRDDGLAVFVFLFKVSFLLTACHTGYCRIIYISVVLLFSA